MVLGDEESVLFREVSLFQGCPYRGVPLYAMEPLSTGQILEIYREVVHFCRYCHHVGWCIRKCPLCIHCRCPLFRVSGSCVFTSLLLAAADQPECKEMSQTLLSPSQPTPQDDSTSSHPPTVTPSQLPTITSPPSHPPTVTVDQSSVDNFSHLDLLGMNSESENEDDELFTLSNSNHFPPGDRNFTSDLPRYGEDDDKLQQLRAELERDVEQSLGEDGGRCVTQVHAVLDEEEEEERVGVACKDGGRFVTQLHNVGEGGGSACGDGGRCVTQLHELREDLDKTGPSPTQYSDIYANADDLARHMQQVRELPLPPNDLPDGGLISRPPPPSEEGNEEEEEVVFPGLVPLSCRCYYSDEEEMKSLKAMSEPVLAQTLAMIHSSLSKTLIGDDLSNGCSPFSHLPPSVSPLSPLSPSSPSLSPSLPPPSLSLSLSLPSLPTCRETGAAIHQLLSNSLLLSSERGVSVGTGVSLLPGHPPAAPRHLPLQELPRGSGYCTQHVSSCQRNTQGSGCEEKILATRSGEACVD